MTAKRTGIRAAMDTHGQAWRTAAERFHRLGGFADDLARREWAEAWLQGAPSDPHNVVLTADSWAVALMGELSALDPQTAWQQLEYLLRLEAYKPTYDWLVVGEVERLVRHFGMPALTPVLDYARTHPAFVGALREVDWHGWDPALITALRSLEGWSAAPPDE